MRHAGPEAIGRLEPLLRELRGLDGLTWLDLGVGIHNAPARALYERAGFAEWGIERDALRVDGAPVDEAHMSLELTR